MNKKNILIGLGTAIFFTLFYFLGAFENIAYQVNDFMLGFRAEREETGYVAFLDIDDNAIAFNGIFPWPRSITADALLRLKEFGAIAAVFDVEYIDRGPPGVDAIYLRHGLSADFNRTFSEISSVVGQLFNSISSGRAGPDLIDEYSRTLNTIISDEHNNLYNRARRISRDNDLYMVQASKLFGRSWATLNLRGEALADDEQRSRRPMAEELFSHPVTALPGAERGSYVDILPTFPDFARSARGAGFTNVVVDGDGTRRRLNLTQNIHDHWYLQLALAPLVEFLGNPDIELDNNRMILRGARMPNGTADDTTDGIVKDITIPLDGSGRMILDWPRENYFQTYTHISFHDFSLLDELEAELEYYARALNTIDFFTYGRFDSSLVWLPFLTAELDDLFNAVNAYKEAALEYTSEEYFQSFVNYRNESRYLIQEFLDMQVSSAIINILPSLIEAFPGAVDFFVEEIEYIEALENVLSINLFRYNEIAAKIEDTVRNRFCIIGRSDTGTTDIGTNPFHPIYINVGTHGVVIDMILSETFINPVSMPWRVALTFIFVLLFFIISVKIAPIPRAIIGILVAGIAGLASILLFRFTGILFNPLLTLMVMVSAVILREIISYAGSEQEKQFIRKAFSTYVSDDVVKEIIADPTRLQLGGTMRHMSAVFTDIKGFSGISERLDPEQLVSLLNYYLSSMSDEILEKKGTIDKYIGDAIVAFFGAPMPMEDHATKACLAAIAMKKIEKEVNIKIMEEKLSPVPILTRVGINTGSMVAGNMGTGNKMNYTIMGSAVNLAARLESVNNQYGTWIIASDNTIRETNGLILSRRIDKVRVVGINEPVLLHELLDTVEEADPKKKMLVDIFHNALDYFQERKWKEAMEGFSESFTYDSDGPSLVYLERCKNFIVNPPPADWDGVRNLTEK
ncbi:MAG: CHASE2 domain-containing protein [Treponema sp.]|nr:CHASE2 domain-containing protein [Treponema sp.]